MEKLNQVRDKVVALAQQNRIQWSSLLSETTGELVGYLGNMGADKSFDLALLCVRDVYQLWAVRRNKTRSIFIPGNNRELAELAEHYVSIREEKIEDSKVDG